MATRIELEYLAQLCQECVESDSGSIDQHLESCPVCQEHQEKAETFNQTLEVLQMMAAKQEEERHRILNARFDKFTKMEEHERMIAMRGLMDALGELTEEDRVRIVRTRTNILTALPREEREMLMQSLKKIIVDWPRERKDMEQQAIMAATQDYGLLKRMMVRNMFNKMMD